MKNYLSILFLLLSTQSYTQKDWIKETKETYSIMFPNDWNMMETENSNHLLMSGPVDEQFKKPNGYLGTTLFISTEPSSYASMELVAEAYKNKLYSSDFLKKTKIIKEEKFTFNGEEAIAITFIGKIQKFSTACRIILFQHDDLYYELSVTYDQHISSNLLNEILEVMESFRFTK